MRSSIMRFPPGAGKRIASLLKTFLGEAAVLVFVFPVLDRAVSSGLQGISRVLIAWSLSASFILLSIAMLIAVIQESDNGE